MRLFIDDKPATIEEVCKIVGIRANEFPSHAKSKSFERLGFKNKRDVQTGKPIVPRGHGIPCSINLNNKHTGEVHKITYSENAKQEVKFGVSRIKHTPVTIMLPGTTLSLREDERVKFFFLYIHPYNTSSPLNIGKSNPSCIYEFNDTEKAAKAAEKAEDMLLDALILIKELGDNEVRQIAKGYKMDQVDDLSIAEVRALLRAKAKLDPAQFVLNMEHNEIALIGIIKDAMDKGVIKRSVSGTEVSLTIGDRKICSVNQGVDEVASLRYSIEKDLETYMPLLTSSIETVVEASVLTKPENNKYFDKFKKAPSNENVSNALDQEDKQALAQQKIEDEKIAKYREYAKLDVNEPGLHKAKQKAMLDKAPEIMAQYEKDIESGFLPEGTPKPKLTIAELV